MLESEIDVKALKPWQSMAEVLGVPLEELIEIVLAHFTPTDRLILLEEIATQRLYLTPGGGCVGQYPPDGL